MPGKMVYEWEQRRDEIYDMYITQNKSLEEIMDFYRPQNFVPSKRAFQARFKEWNFPAKHRPAHKDADLQVRIRELWEVNTGNKQMLEVLRAEGWDVKERELTKLRKEQNLLLRQQSTNSHAEQGKRKQNDASTESNKEDEHHSIDLAPEIIAKRQARQQRLMEESEERLKAGTRRRRTKVWSGLPPDPAAPPRYPSELTMEECKGILGLDKQSYQEMRDTFEEICRGRNIVKKTSCEADAWRDAKEELISRTPHLQSMFYGPDAGLIDRTQQPMAFELICMDVTKKIRTTGTRVTITEAKSFLRLTPQEARDVRAAFDAILKEDYFVSKLEVPREHWEGLKAKWIDGSPTLQEKLAGGSSDPDYRMKQRCVESIAADVQKRHRDQQTRNDPTHLTKSIDPARNPYASTVHTLPSAGFAPPPLTANQGSSVPFPPGLSTNPPSTTPQNPNSSHHLLPTNPANNQPLNTNPTYPLPSHLQIDPTLLASHPPTTTTTTTIPIYFRLSPTSQPPNAPSNPHPKIWLATLTTPYTLSNLHTLALSRAGGEQRVRVGRVEGVQGSGGDAVAGQGWSIDEDAELEAFLEMCGAEGKGKVVFVVEILGG
ncbi:hypothetical protein ACLMJK_008267 [Lecanora helva]